MFFLNWFQSLFDTTGAATSEEGLRLSHKPQEYI